MGGGAEAKERKGPNKQSQSHNNEETRSSSSGFQDLSSKMTTHTNKQFIRPIHGQHPHPHHNAHSHPQWSCCCSPTQGLIFGSFLLNILVFGVQYYIMHSGTTIASSSSSSTSFSLPLAFPHHPRLRRADVNVNVNGNGNAAAAAAAEGSFLDSNNKAQWVPQGPPRVFVCMTGQLQQFNLEQQRQTLLQPLKEAGYEPHVALLLDSSNNNNATTSKLLSFDDVRKDLVQHGFVVTTTTARGVIPDTPLINEKYNDQLNPTIDTVTQLYALTLCGEELLTRQLLGGGTTTTTTTTTSEEQEQEEESPLYDLVVHVQDSVVTNDPIPIQQLIEESLYPPIEQDENNNSNNNNNNNNLHHLDRQDRTIVTSDCHSTTTSTTSSSSDDDYKLVFVSREAAYRYFHAPFLTFYAEPPHPKVKDYASFLKTTYETNDIAVVESKGLRSKTCSAELKEQQEAAAAAAAAAAEQEKQQAAEKAEQEKLAAEKAEQEKQQAAEKAEQERVAAEAAEKERLEKEVAQKKAEQEKVDAEAAEKAEQDKQVAEAAGKAEQDKQAAAEAAEKAEQDKQVAEVAEAAEKAEQDKQVAEAAEKEHLEKEANLDKVNMIDNNNNNVAKQER